MKNKIRSSVCEHEKIFSEYRYYRKSNSEKKAKRKNNEKCQEIAYGINVVNEDWAVKIGNKCSISQQILLHSLILVRNKTRRRKTLNLMVLRSQYKRCPLRP